MLINHIEQNYWRDITMEELFALVPMSRRSIEMRFKKATGKSLYQYLLNFRVEHLAYLLRTTDRSYIDLASEVGFKDFTNVSRTFRRYKGCSPMEYRKMLCVL